MQGTLSPCVVAELKASAFAAGRRYYNRRVKQFPYASAEMKRIWEAMSWDVVFDTYTESVQEQLRQQRIDAYAEGRSMVYAR